MWYTGPKMQSDYSYYIWHTYELLWMLTFSFFPISSIIQISPYMLVLSIKYRKQKPWTIFLVPKPLHIVPWLHVSFHVPLLICVIAKSNKQHIWIRIMFVCINFEKIIFSFFSRNFYGDMVIIFTTFSVKYEVFLISDHNHVVMNSEREKKLLFKSDLICRISKSGIKRERQDLNKPSLSSSFLIIKYLLILVLCPQL